MRLRRREGRLLRPALRPRCRLGRGRRGSWGLRVRPARRSRALLPVPVAALGSPRWGRGCLGRRRGRGLSGDGLLGRRSSPVGRRLLLLLRGPRDRRVGRRDVRRSVCGTRSVRALAHGGARDRNRRAEPPALVCREKSADREGAGSGVTTTDVVITVVCGAPTRGSTTRASTTRGTDRSASSCAPRRTRDGAGPRTSRSASPGDA